jgi:hypothetical protein
MVFVRAEARRKVVSVPECPPPKFVDNCAMKSRTCTRQNQGRGSRRFRNPRRERGFHIRPTQWKANKMQWFRSWHGAPTDLKWRLIAKRADVSAGMVSAIFWALLDCASEAEDRGNVENFDVEAYAEFSGFTEDQVNAVISAFGDRNIIVEGRLSTWEKRQPGEEDPTNAQRQRRYRAARSETPATAKPALNWK